MKHNRFILFTFAALAAVSLLHAPRALAQEADTLTARDAMTLVTQELIKQGAGEDIEASIDGARDEDVIASSASMIAAQADGLEFDKGRHRWSMTLLLTSGGRNLAPVKLSGRFEEMTRIPVLKSAVQAPGVISENDIDWDRQPASHLRRNTVTDARELIGKSPRHVISPGRPIRTDEVAGPALVGKGTQVTLYFRSHNLEIKTFGEALESGAKGDVIRVRNITSKAVIQGTVEPDGHVLVTSPDSDSAEAM